MGIQDEAAFAPKPPKQPPKQQRQHKQHSGRSEADDRDVELPRGVRGALLGGTDSNRPQRSRRLPAKCLGEPGVLNAAQEWEYNHQRVAEQQQDQQREVTYSQQQPTQGRKPARPRVSRKQKAGEHPANPAADSGGTATGAAGEQRPAAEGGPNHEMQHLPDNFRESGLWDDDAHNDEDEQLVEATARNLPCLNSSADDSEELGETCSAADD